MAAITSCRRLITSSPSRVTFELCQRNGADWNHSEPSIERSHKMSQPAVTLFHLLAQLQQHFVRRIESHKPVTREFDIERYE